MFPYRSACQSMKYQQMIIGLLTLQQLTCNFVIGYAATNTSTTQTDIDLCTCSCTSSPTNTSKDAATSITEAYAKADVIEKELTVEKNSTSFSIRTKVSIQDDRPLAKSLGVIGVVFISVIFSCIILLDIGTFINYIIVKFNQRKQKQPSSLMDEYGNTRQCSTFDVNCEHHLGNQDVVNVYKFRGPTLGASENLLQDCASSSIFPNSENELNLYISSRWPFLQNNAPVSTQSEDMFHSLRTFGDHSYHHDSHTVRIRALMPSYEDHSEV